MSTTFVRVPEQSQPSTCADSVLVNQNSALSPAAYNGRWEERPRSNGNGTSPRRSEQTTQNKMTYNDYDDDNYDYEDDEDDDYVEEGEEIRQGSRNATVPFDQPVVQNSIKSAQSSQHNQPSKDKESSGVARTRRRPRQRADQQQHHERPHAAVEKRYRSVVNSKIQQLRASIPPSKSFNSTNANPASENSAVEAAQEMPTKSIVLDRATQYINYLVATYEQYETERTELRRKLQYWLDNLSPAEAQLTQQDQR